MHGCLSSNCTNKDILFETFFFFFPLVHPYTYTENNDSLIYIVLWDQARMILIAFLSHSPFFLQLKKWTFKEAQESWS